MSKRITLLLIAFLTVSSLVIVEAMPALAYIKPSVPEFTVKIQSNPYYVPETYLIDPYTGENVTASFGYWAENQSVVFTIKNQPFTPYTDPDGNNVNLTFNIRVKGHYEHEWTNLGHFDPSDSGYTVKSYAFGRTAYLAILSNVPSGGKLDMQVDARIGYYTVDMPRCAEYFTGETSGWSETYTLTMDENQNPTTSPGTTPTPGGESLQTDLLRILPALALIVIVLGAGFGLLSYLARKK